MLVLDAGDYSMGTAFAAATREIGGELKLMGMMGYDATTFGNHEFDLGPDGLGRSISVAAKAGRIPAVVASNTDFSKKDPTLADLQRLAKTGVIRRYTVIERGGLRFGIFGLLGKEAQHYTSGGAVTYRRPYRDRQRDGEDSCATRRRSIWSSLSATAVWRKGRTGASPKARTCAWPRPCRASTW